ncbi:hypothetical protein BGX21_009705, partial [Mortierella sp. AD011]
MFRDIFSSPSKGLPLKDVIELANKHLEDARNANTSAKALLFCGNAKATMKGAENIIVNKSVGGQTINADIANTYHKHGKLLEGLGQLNEAQKSYSKATKWGYLDVTSQHISPPQPANANAFTLGSSVPPGASSITPPIPHGQTDDGVPCEVKDQTASSDSIHALEMIFIRNVTPPTVKFDLPEIGGRITSTLQLAYCIGLLRHSLEPKGGLDKLECDWLGALENDPDEQRRLQLMTVDVIRAFVRDERKTSDVVSEAVSLAAVLEQDEFRKLLGVLVNGIDRSVLLKIDLLDGLAYLMKNALPGDLDADDLIKILELLSKCLKGTHQQSTRHMYRLALAISRVLDSMVDNQVKGLEREQLHEPLSQYLKELQQSSDARLVYQAAYAYQALRYIPDDETILQTMLRRTGKVVKGISGVVSAVKALNLNSFIDGLQHIQVGIAGTGEAISMIGDAYENAKALTENGQELLESLKEGLSFTRKSAWYPALRGLDALIQDGRFTELETLIRGTVCRRNPAFQLGVCQRLGELAVNALWDTSTRECAVSFLGEIYSNDMLWGWHTCVKQLILQILSKLIESTEGGVASHAEKILQGLEMEQDPKKRIFFQNWFQEKQCPDISLNTPLIPCGSRLLDCVQGKPDVETHLRQFKQERLKEGGQDVYISPRAKVNTSAIETFDLTSAVQGFLASEKKVFLLLGDSGAGKSTFNRALEMELWHKYGKTDARIPLFIYLPSIEKLERDLIGERLRRANFTESQIRELKAHHKFILICDGYDETQQIRNLYTSNQLNQPGQWHAQMVISCRTEYTGFNYRDCFRPIDHNNRVIQGLFQEAILTPFDKNQIRDYIHQYVSGSKPSWETKDYLQALKKIPNLQDLVTNPFLLKIAVDVLPSIVDTISNFSQIRITRVELYDRFVQQWIERNKIRLGEMELSPRDKEAFITLLGSGFSQHCIEYLKGLATEVYDKQTGNPVISYSDRRDQGTWKATFFDSNDGKNLIREAIPLIHNNDQYRFIHRSILEYGLSLAVYDPSAHTESTEQEPTLSRRGSVSSVLSFEIPTPTEEPVTTIEQPILDSPLGKRSFVNEPSILQFLGERTQQRPAFKKQLLAVIERSKSEKTARIASANAITVLVRVGVQFIGADLQDIKIPGADLSYGMFDSARLNGADLRKAKFHNTWLRKANLSRAEMTGAQFGELPFLQQDDYVTGCAYWHDGKTLAVGLNNSTFSLYDTSSWEKIKEFEAYDDQFGYFLFSETSGRVAYVDSDFVLRLLDVETGDCFQSLEGHDDPVESVAYSLDGSRLATGSLDNTVRLWDVDTGECIHIFKGHSDLVSSIVYSPRGDQIASASHDKTVQLWDVETGECIHVLQHDGEVLSIAYPVNGIQIASASCDETVRLWDVGTGNCLRSLQGHVGDVNWVVYSPNGSHIASGGQDKTIRLWDVETGDCIHTLQGHGKEVTYLAYSPNGNQIAAGCWDNTVRLWTIESNYFERTTQGHTGLVYGVAYSPNGSHVVSGGRDRTLRLWDLETGKCVHILQGHSHTIFDVAYSPKGGQIASASGDKTVKMWSVEDGKCTRTLQGHVEQVGTIAYSPSGTQVASGSDDQTVRLWDVETGECIRTMPGHIGEISYVVYSPKGDRIASASLDMTVILWDVETGDIIHVLQGHEGYVYGVSYSPNGDRIASGSDDKTVRLWDVETGDCIHTLDGHDDGISSVACSSDGDLIASGSYDQTVRLWDVETGQCLTVISGFNGHVFSVALNSDHMRRQYLITGSGDKSVRHWEIIKDQDQGHYEARLCWSSSHDALTVIGATFEDVKGLGQVNQTLLSQRGAYFTTSSSVLLPLKDVINLANRHLEDARDADTPAKALLLCGDAKALVKDAENIINKNVRDQTPNADIANAYYKHGKLLEELGQHSKAQKSYSKAEKWGYLHVVSHRAGSSQLADPDAHTLGPFISSTPINTAAISQEMSDLSIAHVIRDHAEDKIPSETKDQTTSGDTVHAVQTIFVRDVAPPVAKFSLPEIGARITSTPQLAYCISLLQHSLEPKEGLDRSESDWLQTVESDQDEQRRLRSMAVDIIRAFVRDELKTLDVVSEAVSLAAVLEQDEFQKLLRLFVDGIDQSLLLEVHLLEGLAYLMKNSPPESFDVDDLVKILELLSMRLKGVHQQSTQHTYQLSLTVSRVLDSMVDSQVKGIKRKQLHEPLSQYLKDLQQSSDPRLVYQAAYAYQALQYIPDDETILQTMLRRTGKVAIGITGVASAVKALDLERFIDGLQDIQEGLRGAGEVISMVGNASENAMASSENGHSLFESLKERLCFTRKSAWYPALRGLDALLQEGRVAEFERLVRESVCQRDPAFQLGVCQRLGELAINTLWDTNTRQCAVSFLGEMYSKDVLWGWHASVKQLILRVLSKLTEFTEGDVANHAEEILQGLAQEKQHPNILLVTPPILCGSRLLDCVQSKSDVKTPLLQLKQERLKEVQDLYIFPRAKASSGTTETFDLTSKVREFLSSSKKVFLILGYSGAGKSTFNRALEIDLWHKYGKTDERIPLFIHLPSIEKLERDLIGERLRKANFTEKQIRELKAHHEFILICDGYDECPQARNLYTSNQLNQPGEWRAQMVISCRAEYTGADYKNHFQPTDRNNRENSDLFQEAILSPFNKDQTDDYIDQYVFSRKLLWKAEDYRRALEQILSLQDLVTNPFLLKLAMDVLPQLLDKNSEFSRARITRLKLYDEFIAQWIARGQKRLFDMDLSPRDREAFKMLSDSGFNQLGIAYLKDLSAEIYKHHEGNPVVEYLERRDNRTWKKPFFGSNDGNNLLREAIPLIRNNNQYRFMHKSILEYGLSLAVFDPSTFTEETNQEPRSSRRESVSSVLSFEIPETLKEGPAITLEQSLLDSPFGKRSFVNEPSILELLGERMQQQPLFKDQLLAVIERSKTDKVARIAAANAITVLVRAGVQFIGADLRGVKIPGADLSYGMFDSARLDGADLRKTKLRNVWLRNASLDGSEMMEAQFGELPFLRVYDVVRKCAYWHDGKTLAVGLNNGHLSLYDTSSWRKTKEFPGYEDQCGMFLFSETSDRIAYNDYGYKTLRLVDAKTGNCFQALQGHTNNVIGVVYSPCGSKVASGSRDMTAR